MTLEEIQESRRILARDDAHPLWRKAFLERAVAGNALVRILENLEHESVITESCVTALERLAAIGSTEETQLTMNEIESIRELVDAHNWHGDAYAIIHLPLLKRLMKDWARLANLQEPKFKWTEVAP